MSKIPTTFAYPEGDIRMRMAPRPLMRKGDEVESAGLAYVVVRVEREGGGQVVHLKRALN